MFSQLESHRKLCRQEYYCKPREEGNYTEKEQIAGTIAQKYYAAMMGTVDRSDQDGVNYSTKIITYRFYRRILCWLLDRVVHIHGEK